MICPVCNKAMFVIEYKQIELDYCQSCSGVWFDSGELELLLEAGGVEGVRPFLGKILKLPDAPSPERKRKCPICTRNMRKVRIGDDTGVVVDVCGEQHGIWFDGGEVASLLKIITDRSSDEKKNESEIMGFLKEVFHG
ncbi:MAG: zf-TFIIB domain-containing protein [Dehalococcoidales bacterium]|nr:zf-TFIIB domain-containing protein [Dehalococcoidales bacterium]